MIGTSEQEQAHSRNIGESIVGTLWKAKKFIITNFIIVSILAAGFSLLLPVWYQSSATVLPPMDAGQLSVGSGSLIAALGFGGATEDINKYMSIIKSRRLREAVVRDFNLMEVYGTKTFEGALQALGSKIDVQITEEGAMAISVLDRDSVRLRELGNTTINLATQAGHRNRRFIEARINAIEQEFDGAEKEIRTFTARYGTFDLPAQLSGSIEQLARMEVLLAQSEIEYNVGAAEMGIHHPLVIRLQAQRDELAKKFDDLTTGKGRSKLLINLGNLPVATTEYIRLMKDIEIYRALLEFLYPQYEQARLQEAKDEPTLMVLDYPTVPESKAKPRRSRIVLAAGLFSVLLSSAWIIVLPGRKPNRVI
jgi:uncharacterized protein involved in exopolysaccharide biosynthesis